jgi:hypothetical protein
MKRLAKSSMNSMMAFLRIFPRENSITSDSLYSLHPVQDSVAFSLNTHKNNTPVYAIFG